MRLRLRFRYAGPFAGIVELRLVLTAVVRLSGRCTCCHQVIVGGRIDGVNDTYPTISAMIGPIEEVVVCPTHETGVIAGR